VTGKIANKRLANKVMWALEDIIGCCLTMRDAITAARRRAEQTQDVIVLARLGDIADQVGVIERRARQARRGEYDG